MTTEKQTRSLAWELAKFAYQCGSQQEVDEAIADKLGHLDQADRKTVCDEAAAILTGTVGPFMRYANRCGCPLGADALAWLIEHGHAEMKPDGGVRLMTEVRP